MTPPRLITVKVLAPNTRRFRCLRLQAPLGMRYTSGGIEEVLGRLVAGLELRFAGARFCVIPTGRAQFNVVPEPTAHA